MRGALGLARLWRLLLLLGVLVAAWSRLADALLARPLAPPAGDPGRFAGVDGVRTYYRVPGQGPALVLLHGLGVSHLTGAAPGVAVQGALAEDRPEALDQVERGGSRGQRHEMEAGVDARVPAADRLSGRPQGCRGRRRRADGAAGAPSRL